MAIQALFATFFRWIALIFLVVLLATAARTLLFVTNSTEVAATVTGYREIRNYAPFGLFRPEDAARYFVEAEYRSRDGGRAYTVTASRGSSERGYEIGEQISVRYSRGNPERARINTLGGLWGGTVVFVILTGIFGTLAVMAPFAFRLGDQNDSSTT